MAAQRYVGKSVIVTGAASGIGRGVAERLAAEGAALVIGDVNGEGLEAVAQKLRAESGVTVTPIAYDQSDRASCVQFVDSAMDALGRLDSLMNIAGILDWGHFTEMQPDRWERMLAINLSGMLYLTQRAIPHLIAAKGNIINTASSSGLTGHAYYVGYGATKGAIISATKNMALEYIEHGVRANVICPGGTDTAITHGLAHPDNINEKLWHRIFPKNEWVGLPSDQAAAYAYLGSDEARFVTGSVLAVDGGLTAG